MPGIRGDRARGGERERERQLRAARRRSRKPDTIDNVSVINRGDLRDDDGLVDDVKREKSVRTESKVNAYVMGRR